MSITIKIERREHKDTTVALEHHVKAKGTEIILYSNREKLAPESFGLYIWTLPEGEVATQIIKQAIEQITNKKVRKISFGAGNGHGSVDVVYSVLD